MRVGTARDTQAGVGEGHSAAKQREERRGEERRGDFEERGTGLGTVASVAAGQRRGGRTRKSSEGAPGPPPLADLLLLFRRGIPRCLELFGYRVPLPPLSASRSRTSGSDACGPRPIIYGVQGGEDSSWRIVQVGVGRGRCRWGKHQHILKGIRDVRMALWTGGLLPRRVRGVHRARVHRQGVSQPHILSARRIDVQLRRAACDAIRQVHGRGQGDPA